MTALPASMPAVEIETPGGPEVLKPVTRALPVPRGGEVLIRVVAAGVNRPDVMQRQGLYPLPPGVSDLPGLEVAGTIAAVGADVTGLAIGDAVCALTPGGGYAGYCTTPAPQCLPIPAGLSMIEAAALPETCFTVWINVFDRGRLAPGETLLVQGGASGIGTTAIQIAAARGHRVFVTAGTDDKCRACEALGAERGINYRTEDFVEIVRAATDGRGVDVILDMVGGDYVPREIKALAVDGRLSLIAFLGGTRTTLDLAEVLYKRLTLTASTLRPRSVEYKAAIARALEREVWPLIAAGRVRPVIHRTFPLAQAAQAHTLLESSTHTGKIVLTVD